MPTAKPFDANAYWANAQGATLNEQGRYVVGTGNNSPGFIQIDPRSGKISYGNAYEDGKNYWKDESYDPGKDYGLGQGSAGVVVTKRDTAGTPVEFYAGTPGGGGKTFTDLAQARDAAASYKSWYEGQHLDRTRAAGIAGGIASQHESDARNGTLPPTQPTQPTQPGQLTTPGYGEQNYLDTKDVYSKPTELENLYQQNKDAYGKPSNAEKNYDATKGDYNQPSRAEQTWNGFAGKFNDTTALDDMYKRAEASAQGTLSRKGSTGGWGGSGAAARATVGTSLRFQDAKTSALSDWAKTGMGLASTADQGALARLGAGQTAATTADNSALTRIQQGMTAAGQADNGLLTRTTAGQGAATGAQNSMETRLTGGMKSALQIAESQAQTLSAGLDSATKSLFDSKMAALKAQQTAGTITAQQYYDEANDLMATVKLGASALTAWKPKASTPTAVK